VTPNRSTRAQIALEAAITAVIAFVLSLPVLGPLLSRLDDGWGGGDMLSTYVNAYVWGGIRFSVSDQFGFPLAMNLNYFPTSDITQNLFALTVNSLTGGTFTGINLLIVLSFPLVAALTYVVIRMTGLKGALAIALAVAFTFIPFHWGRSLGHTYLATLYSAVIGVGLVLAIGSGAFSRLATQSDRRRRVWFWVVVAIMVLVIAWSGIYYTAFTLILGAAALLWRFAQRASWRALSREALTLASIGILAVAGVVPSLLTTRGDPPLAQLAERLPYESVIFAGNLAMALLPLPQSQLPGMETYNRQVVEAIQAAPYGEATVITNHGTWITSLAVLVFIVGLVIRARRQQGTTTRAGAETGTQVSIAFVAYLTFVTLLFFIPWGLNYLLAGTVTAQIRAWNRLLPILLLLFILGAAAALARTRIARDLRIAIPIAVVVLALTLVDAVLPFRGPYSDSVARGSELSDAGRAYATATQQAIPEQCGVLQLPYMGYPEYGVVGGVNDYDHFWTSITNPGKQWSYGAVKFTDASIWMSQLPQVPTDEQVSLLRAAGFCAIHLDTRGYISEQLVPVQQDLQARFGAPVATALASTDGIDQWELYDIRSASAAPDEAAQAFLHQPFIEVDYNTSTLRESQMQQSWWWTRENVALIDLVPTKLEWPVTAITGAIAAPQCGPVPVTVTLTAGDEQVMTTVLAKPGEPAPFDLALESPASGTAILTVDTPGEGCPEGDKGERRFAQVLDLQPR
jgi:hypothetical protein